MNCKMAWQLAIVFSLVILGGCGATHSIILMPDNDGHVGKAEVLTLGGKQLLDKPGDMTRVTRPKAPPSGAVTADQTYISAVFGEALAVEPAPSRKFTLYFEFGTAVLIAHSVKDIANIVATSKQRKAINISISGHTDSVGSDEFNNKLAMERAEWIKAMVQQQGIKPELISISSYGKADPAIPTPDGVAEPRNRRVEVVIQ